MAYTPYDPVDWKNKGETGAKPINKNNLKKMEDGIKNIEAYTVFFEEIGTIDETTGEITLNSNNSNTTNNEEE